MSDLTRFPYAAEPEPTYEDETPDSATEAGVDEQVKAADMERLQLETFWRRVLSDEVGRRVMWKELELLGTFNTRFANSPAGFPDPIATGFYMGQRAAGQAKYADLLRYAQDGVMEMHRSHDPKYQRPKPKMRTQEE